MNWFSRLRARLYSAGFRNDHLIVTAGWVAFTVFASFWTGYPVFLLLNVPLAMIYAVRLIP